MNAHLGEKRPCPFFFLDKTSTKYLNALHFQVKVSGSSTFGLCVESFYFQFWTGMDQQGREEVDLSCGNFPSTMSCEDVVKPL